MFDLVPSFRDTTTLPAPRPVTLQPGMLQGIHFTMAAEQRAWMLSKIEHWFAERNEIILVASGETNKAGLGYILLEWEGVEIDPLFLAILRHEEIVDDVTVYNRSVGV